MTPIRHNPVDAIVKRYADALALYGRDPNAASRLIDAATEVAVDAVRGSGQLTPTEREEAERTLTWIAFVQLAAHATRGIDAAEEDMRVLATRVPDVAKPAETRLYILLGGYISRGLHETPPPAPPAMIPYNAPPPPPAVEESFARIANAAERLAAALEDMAARYGTA